MLTLYVRNVNEAFVNGARIIRNIGVKQSTRAGDAYVLNDPLSTVYRRPQECVLFDPIRDANPFFHLFEALWILDGRRDVATLAYFNKRMAEFSDDGVNFHAPYGYRLRNHFGRDQISDAIDMLRATPNSRQAVLQIWDNNIDLAGKTKDVPCNDMVKLRINNGALDIIVFCRSNDMVWGAYGANAVQFSFIQQYIAGKLGVAIGTYTQVSCDYHAYCEVFHKTTDHLIDGAGGYHLYPEIPANPLFMGSRHEGIDAEITHLIDHVQDYTAVWCLRFDTPFLSQVAQPMAIAYSCYKQKLLHDAVNVCREIPNADWRTACIAWLERRIK